MDRTLQLEMPLGLPGVKDERDQCVARLKEEVTKYDGIEEAQVILQDRQALLRLRYDPNVISVEQVRRIAERAGAQIARRYQHEVLSVSGMDCTDCSVSVEHIVSRLPGIIDVSVNYASEEI